MSLSLGLLAPLTAHAQEDLSSPTGPNEASRASQIITELRSELSSDSNPVADAFGSSSPVADDSGVTAEELRVLIEQAIAEGDDYSDPFYLPPAEFDPTPGAVIRTQDATYLLDPGQLIGDPNLTKMLYTSKMQDGQPVAVSGFVVEPTLPWQGEGPTPTLVMAPGTRGAADWCAPSRGPFSLANFNLENPNPGFMVNYEWVSMYQALSLGMRVIMTDYIGLGTPGAHTYVNSIESGQALLDAARAGLKVAGVPADSPIALYGYSQGGGASAAGAELATTYAPELNIVGTYAGSPPSRLTEVMRSIEHAAISGALGYALVGFATRYPDIVYPIAAQELNHRGVAFLTQSATDCVTGTAMRWGLNDSASLTKSGRPVAEVITQHPEAVAMLDEQLLGNRDLNAPIMVATSSTDDIIPTEQVQEMGRSYCSRGNSVTISRIELPSFTGQLPLAVNHAVALLEDNKEAFEWLIDRFNGKPNPNSCGSF